MGGREKKCLPAFRQFFYQVPNIFNKTEIKHVIGLIQNQRFHPVYF